MKKKSLEQILLAGYGGTRSESKYLKCLSDEAYCGYVTAMTVAHNHTDKMPEEIYTEVIRLFKEGKL